MSKRRRAGIIGLIALLAAVLVLLDRGCASAGRRGLLATRPPSADDFAKYDGKTFAVTRVVDGDTLDIDVPDGQYEHTRIRLWGVDAPETGTGNGEPMYYGPQAGQFARESALGKRVTVYMDQGNRTRGKYGRLLAYVELPDDSILNELLLTEGFAFADLRFRHALYHKYQQLEASARRQQKGLWKAATREQLPLWLQQRKPSLLRPN